jgi:hypothetical protein
MATYLVADPYDPGPISPIGKPHNNIAFWTQQAWKVGRLIHIETIPASPQSTQDLGAINNNASSAQTELTVINAPTSHLFHLRCCVLDPFQALFMLPKATHRHNLDSITARVTAAVGLHDPNYASTTMFIWGNKNEAWVTGYNESGYNLSQARLRFWGFRYEIALYSDNTVKEFSQWMTSVATEGDMRGSQYNNPLGEAVTIISSDAR